MAVTCSMCGSRDVHSSRFRSKDLGQLLKLRVPARCHTCMERDYVTVIAAPALKRAHKRGRARSQRPARSTAG